MPLSNSVLHRYTPPTCTLEIVVPTSSPMPRETGQPVTTLLRFQLRFDDPQMPEEQKINIQGDREQLAALHEAITTYVQDLLNQSPDRFNPMVRTVAHPSLDATVSPTPIEVIPPKQQNALSGNILLQPGSSLGHNLFLGPLANKESGPVIQLSVLQLFDLANALDESAADIVALPDMNRPKLTSAPPAWATIAVILLLAVGFTTAVVQVLNWTNSPKQVATKSTFQGSSSKNQTQIAQPSALPTLSTPVTPPKSLTSVPQGSSSKNQTQIALQPSVLPTLSTPIPSQSSSEKLPLLPAVGSIVTSGSSIPSSSASPRITTVQKAPVPNKAPLIAPPTPPDNFISHTTPPPPIVINPSPGQEQTRFIPGETAVPGTTSSTLSGSKLPRHTTTGNNFPLLTPANPNLDSASSVTTRNAAGAASSNNKLTASRDSANLPNLPGTHLGNTSPFKEGVAPIGMRTQPRSTPSAPNQPQTTAFDSIPSQVTEARDYFKQHWTPPSGLNQTLEYSLLLDVDGTIQRIEPLGQAARNFVDRSSIPLIGERFVSPIKSGQPAKIRVVLSPDGKVQTFLETN